MRIPDSLLASIARVADIDAASFTEAHSRRRMPCVRYNPYKIDLRSFEQYLSLASPVAWANGMGYTLKEPYLFHEDPLWHAGAYYAQEASSMFLDFILKSLIRKDDDREPNVWLDVCASPGGKTTILHNYLSTKDILISNDPTPSRQSALIENCIKWGMDKVLVTKCYPENFTRLPYQADLILVDAPCSGSGLFRKKTNYINEWNERLVENCAHRQQQIMRSILPHLKKGGLLIYATCSYSTEENEDIIDYVMERENFTSIELRPDKEWGALATESPIYKAKGYRFFPHLCDGEGFYISILRSISDDLPARPLYKTNKKKQPKTLLFSLAKDTPSSMIENTLELSLRLDEKRIYRRDEDVYAMSPTHKEQCENICPLLRPSYIGGLIGKQKENVFTPRHSLAMNPLLFTKDNRIELNRNDALCYIHRQFFDAAAKDASISKWELVSYADIPLGFIKTLQGGRYNNYYPTNWNIGKPAF